MQQTTQTPVPIRPGPVPPDVGNNTTTIAPPRVITDPVFLLRGNPEHPEHDVLGMRNPGGIQPPELMLVGGAQVYGAGVSASQNWPAVLQARMGGGVVNAGLPGWGPVQYALAVEELLALSPRRVMVCLTPASDLSQALQCAKLSVAPLARALRPEGLDTLVPPDDHFADAAARAIDKLAAERPELAPHELLAVLAKRGQPDIDACSIEDSRFYLAAHSLHANQDLENPAIAAGLDITVKTLAHLRELSDTHGFSLTILLLPSREYLVCQRQDEASLRDREALERLGMAETSVLGELRAACAGNGLRCFDLTGYLKHFIGSGIYAQDSRHGGLSPLGCEAMARFIRERVLPGASVRPPLRPAVGGSFPRY